MGTLGFGTHTSKREWAMGKNYVTTCDKHDLCSGSERNVRGWMQRNKEDHRDHLTGEINATTLAESAAHQFDHEEWLDDSTHDVWDWAAEVAGPVNL